MDFYFVNNLSSGLKKRYSFQRNVKALPEFTWQQVISNENIMLKWKKSQIQNINKNTTTTKKNRKYFEINGYCFDFVLWSMIHHNRFSCFHFRTLVQSSSFSPPAKLGIKLEEQKIFSCGQLIGNWPAVSVTVSLKSFAEYQM